MKLVPFSVQKKETDTLNIYRVTLFLTEGGKALWEIGEDQSIETIRQEYLVENGFVPLSIQKWNDIYFAHLDMNAMSKQSFYWWNEIQEIPEKKREDCFRVFYFCFEKPNEKLWFNSELSEFQFDGRKETPFAIFQGLKNTYINKI